MDLCLEGLIFVSLELWKRESIMNGDTGSHEIWREEERI